MALLRDRGLRVDYQVAGQTHPRVLGRDGEAYRLALEARVRARDVADRVHFDARFLPAGALSRLIGAADVVLLPYDSLEQVTSGVLIEAVTAGKPVVSTCFPHAVELLGGGAGLLVERQDPAGIAQALQRVLTEPGLSARMSGHSADLAPQLLWPAVAQVLPGARISAHHGPGGSCGYELPDAPFRHLQRLTDHIGLLEHAEGIVPRYEHGYCVDDVARGLVVVCREPSPAEELITLGRRYLYFLAQAQAPDGRFRNRLGYDRRWHDQPGTEDCWGRALWGLGTAAARGPTMEIREESFARSAVARECPLRGRTPWRSRRSVPSRYSRDGRDHAGALTLLDRASAVIGEPPADTAWPWPAPRLSYANAAIAEAVIVAGWKLGRDRILRNGLRMLEWLLTVETRDGHLSVVPAGGWGPGEVRPAFDQQPIEVAALADACMRAATVTGDSSWLAGVEMSVAWFLGDNDAKVPLLDERTGGGCDGLSRTSRNRNQGAESTLAMISVMQQGRRLAAAPQ